LEFQRRRGARQNHLLYLRFNSGDHDKRSGAHTPNGSCR